MLFFNSLTLIQSTKHILMLIFKCWFTNRSIRRSVRSGSIKLKQTYEHLMENGDIGAMNRVSSSRSRPHDLDIKLLQAKRQQAEMRRYNSLFSRAHTTLFLVVTTLCFKKNFRRNGNCIFYLTHLFNTYPKST